MSSQPHVICTSSVLPTFFISYLPTSLFIHLVFCFSSLSHIIIMLLSLFFPLLPSSSSFPPTKKRIAIFSLIIRFVCFFQNWLTFSCTLASRPYLPLPMLRLSLIHTCSVKFPLIFLSFIRCSLSSVSLRLLYPFSFSSFCSLSWLFLSSFPFTASCEAATQPWRNRRAQTEHMNVN